MENKLKEWLYKIRKNEKLPKKNQILIVFLIGVLLLVIAFPVPEKKEEQTRQTEKKTQT